MHFGLHVPDERVQQTVAELAQQFGADRVKVWERTMLTFIHRYSVSLMHSKMQSVIQGGLSCKHGCGR
eukprot:888248-Pelagomonas_calceolata.AAC.1